MANIDFQPVCSHCLNVLWGVEVDVEYSLLALGGVSRFGGVRPSACPYCGELFENVRMPIGLPYETPKVELSYTKEGRHYV